MKVMQVRATYKVESESRQGRYYSVTLEPLHCDCPHFRVRLMKIGGECKHIKAVREFMERKRGSHYKDVLDYVSEKGGADSIDVLDRFDERLVDDLIRRGDLIEKDGRMTVMR